MRFSNPDLFNIKRFTKKPVQVEAVMFDTYLIADDIVDWIKAGGGAANVEERIDGQIVVNISTLEGVMTAVPMKHYIVKGIAGEFYPCEWPIFHGFYVEVK